MPRHDYICRHCGTIIEDQRRQPECCDDEMEITMLLWGRGTIQIQSSARDNHEFNNGQGKFNAAFGMEVRDRGQLRELENAYGVYRDERSYDQLVEDMEKKPKRKGFTRDQVKDSYELAKAEVAKGWEPTPVDDPVLKKQLQEEQRTEHPRVADVSMMRGKKTPSEADNVPDE